MYTVAIPVASMYSSLVSAVSHFALQHRHSSTASHSVPCMCPAQVPKWEAHRLSFGVKQGVDEQFDGQRISSGDFDASWTVHACGLRLLAQCTGPGHCYCK